MRVGRRTPHSDGCAAVAPDDRSVELGEDLRGHVYLAQWSEKAHLSASYVTQPHISSH